MMYRRIILSLILPICLLVILFSVIAETAVQALNVSGPITTDTTWTAANSPYVISSPIDIEAGATLTIEAGVTVMIDGNGYAALRINEGAHLEAVGTQIDPIIFTSVANNGAGDWTALGVTGSARFIHTEFRNSYYNLDINGATGGAIILEDSLVSNAAYGLDVEGVDALHRLQMNNVQFVNNNENVIRLDTVGSSTLSNDVTLSYQPGLEGYLLVQSGSSSSDLTIPENVTLTIEAGVTLFHDWLYVEGNLAATGTIVSPTRFVGKTEPIGIVVEETGSLNFENTEMISGGIGLGIVGNSMEAVTLSNSSIISKEYPIIVDADALHRLQMDNVSFEGQSAQNVIIEFNNPNPITMVEDVTLKPQPGLDGYLINENGNIGIPEGIKMTLEAGTKMLFTAPNNTTGIFEINGHLQVNGTPSNPVTLTKMAETGTFWIYIQETGSVMMTHGIIDNMGWPSGQPYTNYPMLITGAGDKQIVFEDSLISDDNDYYVIVEADALHRLQMDNLTFAGGGHKQIFVEFGGYSSIPLITMTESIELWPQPGLDAYWLAEDVRIPENLTMTLKAGVNIQLAEPSPLQVEGQLISEGTAENPVKISKSSMHDESSYWNGIQVKGGDVQLNHTIIQDALVGTHAESGTVQIENSQIISSTQVGMLVEGGTVTAVCSQFYNNQTAAIQVPNAASPNVLISQSVFEGNGVGVWNLGDTAVSAVNNWWGSAAGPQPGTDVIGDVLTEPWLALEPDCISSVYETYLPLVIRP